MESAVQQPVARSAAMRKPAMKLWQLFVAAVGFHIVLAVASSPSLFTKEDTTPDGLLAKARAYVDDQKYEEAEALYQQVLNQKPQIPAVFVEADKEMRDVKVKALQARKKAAEDAKAAKGDGKKPGEGEKPGTGAGGTEGTGAKPPDGTGAKPPVELPTLPDIGGDGI